MSQPSDDTARPPAAPAGTGAPKPSAERPGSDPPKQSGDPAARNAGAGAPAMKPADPSEIDRSTDA